jgi:hypothetical protein
MRVVRWILFAIVLLAGAAIAFAITERIPLAERWLHGRIAARGIGPAALRVVRLDARGIVIEGLALGAADAPDLAIAKLEADWSLRAIEEGRFDAVHVSGLRLLASLQNESVTAGSLDPLWKGEREASAAPLLLPAREIAIEDATLRVDTPQGIASGTLGGALREIDGGIDGSFALDVSGAGLRAKGRLAIAGALDAPRFDATLEPTGGGPLTGKIAARGQWKGADGFEAALALREVAVTLEAAKVTGLYGAIELRGPPLHTPKGQLVSFAVADVGVPLTNGLVSFALRRDGKVAVERASLAFAGGELFVADVVVDPRATRQSLTLRAKDLDLAALLAQASLPGLDGSGRVGGELPLVRDGAAIAVSGGLLRARDPGGTIRYTPSDSVRAMAAARPMDLGLAVDAFADFRFEILEARLDGDLDGAMKVGLHVKGTNPAFQDGRPVELNLNLDAHLSDLVRAGVSSYRVPQVIEERLRAFAEDAKEK